MLHINTVHVQRETLWVKQLAGEQCKMICSAWACKHTYIIESFVGLCTHCSVWKVSSALLRRVCYYKWFYGPTHLCVAHFELHKKVSDSFFLWCGKFVGVLGCLGMGMGMGMGGGDMVHVSGGRGFVWGFRGGRVIWVQGSHSLGKKLLSGVAERALMLRNRLPDGRSWKRLWEGWVESFTILLALLEHRARKMSRMEGRGAPMIFAAVFTVRCRVLRSATLLFPYQTVMQLVSMLSMVPL